MEQPIIANGGLQYVPQIAIQYVYLDFDGESTSYNGEILTVDTVKVQDSALTKERITDIVRELNALYADQNVVFVTERPTTAEYSSIFIGKTSAFDQYGNFAGLAETIDKNNQNKTDKAFVMLDSTASDEAIISTISHETDHLLGTLDHGGDGLAAYADVYVVKSGVTSTGIVLYHDYDSMYISSGGVADNTTINNGSMYISSGGTANKTTVNYGGGMSVGSEGSALFVRENGGRVWLQDGAYVTFVPNTIEGLILEGIMTVHSNTTAVSTVVRPGGEMNIYSGGVADHTSLGGGMVISSGGSANDTTINGYGEMWIVNGGIATRTTLNNGSITVSSGGTAYYTTVNSGGKIIISAGGSADIAFDPWQKEHSVISNDGANVTYYRDAKVYYGDRWGSGLIAKFDSVSYLDVSNGSAIVYSGGVIDDSTIFYNGHMHVSSGGVANRIVNSDGDMRIENGGVANSAIISGYGNITVSSGGIANNTVIAAGVYSAGMSVGSGGTANNTVLSDGTMSIADGGRASNITGRKSGHIYVSSGGIVHNIFVESDGNLSLTGSAGNIVVQGALGGQGYADNVTVESGGEFHGDYKSAVVKSGAWAYVYGTNDTRLYGGMVINSSGTAENTTVFSGGTMHIHSSGSAENTTVLTGGTMYVSGTANQTTVSSGGYIFFDYNASSCNDLTLLQGGLLYGCFAYSKEKHWDTLIDSNGRVTVEDNVFVGSDWARISSGGTAHDMVIHSNGVMWVCNGGIADHTIIENGSIIVNDGGTACNTTVNGSGNLNIYMNGTASGTILNPGGKLNLLSSGSAVDTLIKSGGSVTFSSCGILSNTTIESGGVLILSSGGRANQTTVFSGGTLTLARDGSASGLIVHSGAEVNVIDNVFINIYGSDTLGYVSFSDWGGLDVWSGGFVHDIMIGSNGQLSVRDNGSASAVVVNGGWAGVYNNGTISDITVNDGNLRINGGTAVSTTVGTGGSIVVSSGTLRDTAVLQGGSICIDSYGVLHLEGELQLQSGAIVSAASYSSIDFVLKNRTSEDTYLINDFSLISGTPKYSVTVAENQLDGVYKLAQGVENFSGNITVGNETLKFGMLSTGEVFKYNGASYLLDLSDGNLTLSINGSAELKFDAGQDGMSITNFPGENCTAELSKDNFQTVIAVNPPTHGVDTFGMSSGTYCWRATANGSTYFQSSEFSVADANVEPQLLRSEANGNMDLFFANANGKWTSEYAAQHTGILNGWSGTNEQANLAGKNKLADIFEGSTDANILVMTDDANGDALFVDDIYTALPGTVAEQQVRIAQIDEIRAGAGDDIVDMTSQRFEYVGDGVKIYGGLGNDTIWSNNGNNTLFGDAGNDRLVGGSDDDVIIGGSGNDSLHGGGGDDIFCFGENWGKDTVEQLAGGEITLWFENGSESNWNASTMTYTDGANSVKVSGMSADKITLIFGNDALLRYDELAAAGCFDDAASEKIFEDKNKGFLA